MSNIRCIPYVQIFSKQLLIQKIVLATCVELVDSFAARANDIIPCYCYMLRNLTPALSSYQLVTLNTVLKSCPARIVAVWKDVYALASNAIHDSNLTDILQLFDLIVSYGPKDAHKVITNEQIQILSKRISKEADVGASNTNQFVVVVSFLLNMAQVNFAAIEQIVLHVLGELQNNTGQQHSFMNQFASSNPLLGAPSSVLLAVKCRMLSAKYENVTTAILHHEADISYRTPANQIASQICMLYMQVKSTKTANITKVLKRFGKLIDAHTLQSTTMGNALTMQCIASLMLHLEILPISPLFAKALNLIFDLDDQRYALQDQARHSIASYLHYLRKVWKYSSWNQVLQPKHHSSALICQYYIPLFELNRSIRGKFCDVTILVA